MDHLDIEIKKWAHFRPYKNLWWNALWFFPLSYGCITYQGAHYLPLIIGYIFIICAVITYIAWQLLAYHALPRNLFTILNNISRCPARPIYFIFNLTHNPIQLHTQFIQIINETSYGIQWHQSQEAEIIELRPHAIFNMPSQRMLLTILFRHIAKKRFKGIIIQISSAQLLSRPSFTTLHALMQHIATLTTRSLRYQIIIYNSEDSAAQDAIIFRPEKHMAQQPELWASLRTSFQNIIDIFRQQHNVPHSTEATHFDILMDPTEYLITSITKHNTFQMTALHLLGFGISQKDNTSHPILTPYTHSIWPKVISSTAVGLLVISFMLVVREHYILQKLIQEHKKTLMHLTPKALSTQLMMHLRNKDTYWHNFIPASTHATPTLEYPQEAISIFTTYPVDTQIKITLDNLGPNPPFENSHEINNYYNQTAHLICTLRDQNKDNFCLESTKSILIHYWISKQLENIEDSLLPIDTQADIDLTIRINQLNYIIKNPEIVGEHVHQRLGLVESMLRQQPEPTLQKRHDELQELVELFKTSGSYQILEYIAQRYSHDKAIPKPECTPLNAVDARIMQRLHPVEKVPDNQPGQLQEIVHAWDNIYRSFLPLKGCFPLHQMSTQDCDVHQFNEFFRPDTGLFDQLWTQHFSSYVSDGSTPDISFIPDIAPFIRHELIERYMQVRIIQSVFFATHQPVISIRMRPEITNKDLHVEFRLSHKKYPLDANMHTEIPINWSYNDDDYIGFNFILKEEEKLIEYRGHWAIMRLLKEHFMPNTQQNTIEINALNQTLRLNLIGHPHLAPWYSHLYNGFDLPEKILNTTTPHVSTHHAGSEINEPEDIIIEE